MLAQPQKSPETIADYEREVGRLVAQCESENPDGDAREHPLLRAVRWFLAADGRWAKATIRLYANAFGQELGRMLDYDTFDPDFPEAMLQTRLKNDRPAPAEKATKSKKAKEIAHQKNVAKKRRAKPRKSIPMHELRALQRYFRSKDDDCSLWIVGYIIIASHLGWRPGEILVLQRDGTVLSARAEKHTNNRGLTDTCRIDTVAFFEKSRLINNANLADLLDKWIADARRWEHFYGGMEQLQDNINARLDTACRHLGIKRVCTYTFRHFAIACLKASGFSRAEIAVIINHATDRTAAEHYGRRRFGIKRAKRGFGYDKALLPLVRACFRSFDKSARPSIAAKNAQGQIAAPSEGSDDEASVLNRTI
jgi:integrase